QPGEKGEEQDERDHPEREPDRRSRRAELQKLRLELPAHGTGSEVSSRKTSSRDDVSLASSWTGMRAAKAISPTRSLVVPWTRSAWSLLGLVAICARLSASRRRETSGERIRTEPPTRAVNCSSEASTTSLPWSMIRT